MQAYLFLVDMRQRYEGASKLALTALASSGDGKAIRAEHRRLVEM